jgi:putative transposase
VILSLLETPQFDNRALSHITTSIKGISARNINLLLHRRAPVWRDESFDHVVRKTERSRAKFEYVCNNPVRAGLVASADEYPWLWRSWIEGAQTGVSAPQDFD